MTLLYLILVSGIIGAAMGATVFFSKEEPYKIEIIVASALRNILVGLLIMFTVFGLYLFTTPTLLSLVGFGALYGFLSTLVVFISKGRDKFISHLPMLALGTVAGVLTGLACYVMEAILK